jgi:hypothetical protein
MRDGGGLRGEPSAGPSVAAVQLTAGPQAEPLDRKPPNQLEVSAAPAHPPWIRPIASYERRETSEVHGSRYG